MLGSLIAILCSGVPRFVRVRGGSLHVGVRYLIPWWLGLKGQAFGDVIMTVPAGDDNEQLLAHEYVHRDQCHILGAAIVPLYLLSLLCTLLLPGARYYRDSWFEAQAQNVSRRRRPTA
jgi:hypothetical protein